MSTWAQCVVKPKVVEFEPNYIYKSKDNI
jgi:hypothetical protein